MGALIDRRLRRVRYTKCARGTSLAFESAQLVEGEIELEHIRARLADEAGEALLDALLDERRAMSTRRRSTSPARSPSAITWRSRRHVGEPAIGFAQNRLRAGARDGRSFQNFSG
jgi:hypothetical protein